MNHCLLPNAPQGMALPHELTHLPPQTPMLVAFSGGADSSLLLFLIATYGKAVGAPVYAAHFHHGIRGSEADRDQRFCQAMAKALDVPLFTAKADVPALAATSGRGLELEARLARYAFFRRLMETHQIPLLLTAHHADDQLETLLLRFLRGSGTRGMGGIHPVRDFGCGHIVRPLLSCRKRDIIASCEALGLSYVTDSTNAEDHATRNRLRHHLIPLLEELTDHSAPTHAALRLSSHAREDEDYLSASARSALDLCAQTDGGLNIGKLAALHPAIGKRVLSLSFAQAISRLSAASSQVAEHRNDEGEDGRYSLSALHLESLWSMISKGQAGQQLHLPCRMRAVISQHTLCFTPLSPPSDTAPQDDHLVRPVFVGMQDWDGGRMGILIREAEDTSGMTDDVISGEIIAEATFPVSVFPLWVRKREAGDTVLSHGMHKKLKKLLCDNDVPLDMRDRLPLFCYGAEQTPLWYPGVVFADGFPPSQENGIKITVFHKTARKE